MIPEQKFKSRSQEMRKKREKEKNVTRENGTKKKESTKFTFFSYTFSITFLLYFYLWLFWTKISWVSFSSLFSFCPFFSAPFSLSFSDRISFFLVSLPLSLVLKRHPEGSNSFPSVDTSFLSKFLMMYQKLPKKEGMYQIRIKSLSLESTRKIFWSRFLSVDPMLSVQDYISFLSIPSLWLVEFLNWPLHLPCSTIFFHDFTFSATTTWGKMCSQFSLKLPGREVFIF